MGGRQAGLILLITLIFTLAGFSIAVGANLSLNLGGLRVRDSVRSLQEIRQGNTVIQRLDKSCGPAALSTILNNYYHDKVLETSIILSILKTTDVRVIQARGGFSLLDLKRYAETRGYEGKGYRGLKLEELADLNVPAIVPVRIKGYDHFVVFRGISGDRALISDPAYGAITMKTSRFLEIWKNGIGFIITKQGSSPPSGDLTHKSEELLIPDSAGVMRSMMRISPSPFTRRDF